ncbi:MAG: potassium-transporting ATPase subunit KdpA [Planctomycetota bacterium]
MTPWLQLLAYVAILLALAKPLGAYMARVYEGRPCGLDRVLGPVERLLYRLTGVDPAAPMGWKRYTFAMLAFNFVGFLAVYALQRLQAVLPLNPEGFAAVTPDSSFNTAVSFATNTNWQGYGGETTMSHLVQMVGLAVQNFVSAATGMAILAAVVRGFARERDDRIGNFWTDLVRTTLYILLPLSLVVALVLVSQGVVQTFRGHETATLLDATAGTEVAEQTLPLGPVASQIAIKQLGTNGGGYYNVNSAHPYENATPFSNAVELFAILVISAALCGTLGRMVNDKRQGRALLVAMVVMFVPLAAVAIQAEQSGNPALEQLGAEPGSPNLEGKEVRFGAPASAIWAAATTAASNGSVNSMHDSYTPVGGLVPMWLMQLGEVIFGGVGSGLYGMLAFAIIAVFVAGLMVGRTPEYLGKRIEAFEMKMASLAVLAPCIVVLLGTGLAVAHPTGRATVSNPGAHRLSEIRYAFSSAGNNNGSAFAGLGANTPFYNLWLGVAMLFARYVPAVTMLAVAGSLVRKKTLPASAGTLPTHGPLFVALLVAVVLLVGALTFLPALALGPIAEQLEFAR